MIDVLVEEQSRCQIAFNLLALSQVEGKYRVVALLDCPVEIVGIGIGEQIVLSGEESFTSAQRFQAAKLLTWISERLMVLLAIVLTHSNST
ncbi:MAG: hypothetical protein ABI977_25915 [Acidobacteriota bacterium]